MAAANAGASLGRFGGMGSVEIGELGLLEGDFWVASVVVNLHRLDVRCGDLAVRALVFRVTALLHTDAVGKAGFSAAAIRGGGVDFRGDLLRRVLLRLGLAGHG